MLASRQTDGQAAVVSSKSMLLLATDLRKLTERNRLSIKCRNDRVEALCKVTTRHLS